MTPKGLTVCDKLLIAAYDLDGGEGKPFSAEDLVVSAWKHFPRAFGLRGHNDEQGVPKYPDSNRVFAEIMGSKPIRKRGYLEKIGEKKYQLTVSGRRIAADVSQAGSAGPDGGSRVAGGKATLSRDTLTRLEHLLATRAVMRAQNDKIERVTFHDACVFWGINSASKAIELEGRLADVESIIAETEGAIATGASELRTKGKGLSRSTTELLREVNSTLQEMFESELATIRKRTDQRKV